MNLEILSYGEALDYEPKGGDYGIRIFNSMSRFIIKDLKKSNDWVGVNRYYFDDVWPRGHLEYDWVDTNDPSWNGFLNWGEYLLNYGKTSNLSKTLLSWDEIKKSYPNVTKESLMGLMECHGYPYGRDVCFNEIAAKRILDEFEEVKGDVENVVVHCEKGANRSPAIGIAMNEIYGWGAEGLKERFPFYRKYIYDVMMRVGEGRDSLL
ncbi:hypothetical protein HN903_03585 [archaeon]|jgi:hypothetical protein|nr:hypothetical protein [archaeon]MBT7128811.1 hypothetical protein [archaeon]